MNSTQGCGISIAGSQCEVGSLSKQSCLPHNRLIAKAGNQHVFVLYSSSMLAVEIVEI